MSIEVVEAIIRASFETKGLPEETVKRAIKRVFRQEIPYNSDKWRFYNGRDIYADVEIRIGNAGASMDFRVRTFDAEFMEVLKERVKELEKLIEELARQKELDEILNGWQEEIKPRKALLILPPSLIPQWEHLLFKSGYFFSGDLAAVKTSSDDKFVTYDILKNTPEGYRIIGGVSLLSLGIFSRMSEDDVYAQRLNEEYDLILIDEAHKFRNSRTKRWDNARALRFKKKDDPNNFRNKFIMLTATPVNNTIWEHLQPDKNFQR